MKFFQTVQRNIGEDSDYMPREVQAGPLPLVGFEVLTAVTVKSKVLWVVKLRRFQKALICRLLFLLLLSFLAYSSTRRRRRFIPPTLRDSSELHGITTRKSVFITWACLFLCGTYVYIKNIHKEKYPFCTRDMVSVNIHDI
jgi:hypothetical protein